jgi:hypothetical protein
MIDPLANLTSDIWPRDLLETARLDCAKTRTVQETFDWSHSSQNHDLMQTASSFWPVDWSKIPGHPLKVNRFTHKTIAKVRSVDVAAVTQRCLDKNRNVNFSNVYPRANVNDELDFQAAHGFDRQFQVLPIEKAYPELLSVVNGFDLEYADGSIHLHPPGICMPRHVDSLDSTWRIYAKSHPEILDKIVDPMTKSPTGYYGIRLMMALTDWVPGHVFGAEDEYWSEWKAGDVMMFDWAHARHYTANLAFSTRAVLKINGVTTDPDHWIFKNINHNQITYL